MLPHYSPFKVAETFSVLAACFRSASTSALGRAPGTDPLTDPTRSSATGASRRPTTSPSSSPSCWPTWRTACRPTIPSPAWPLPGLPARPEPWLLGSSPQSAIWAAELGLPYAFADFINPRGRGDRRLYRQTFDSERLAAPRPRSGWTICADTEEEAERLAASPGWACRCCAAGG